VRSLKLRWFGLRRRGNSEMMLVDKIETVSIEREREKKARNVLLMPKSAWWKSNKANKDRGGKFRISRASVSSNVYKL
jgi:hypothetical protein